MKNLRIKRKLWLLVLISLVVMSVPFLAAAQAPSLIKIGLIAGQTEIKLGLTANDQINNLSAPTPEALTVQPDTPLVFGVSEGAITMNGAVVGQGPIQLLPGQTFLTWNGRNFRNELLIVLTNGQLSLVNRLPLEEYLRGVVPKEVPAQWPLAALKAQAIAARTYTLSTLGRHNAEGFDLCSTTHCHVYGGASSETPSTDRAVAETAGQVIAYNGKVINAIYHSCSGGYTEDSAVIWGVSADYLKPVPDWDQNSPYSLWYRSYEWEALQAAVCRSYPQVGRLRQILPAAMTQKGKALKVCLKGDKSEMTLTGEQFRFLVGLPSSNMQIALVYGPEPLITLWWQTPRLVPEVFINNSDLAGGMVEAITPPWDIPEPWSWLQDKTPLRVVVRGSGWGHRIGFSQWGAKGMADVGYNEKQILTYYYQGVSIVNAEDLKDAGK